jgi:hypothetical protein
MSEKYQQKFPGVERCMITQLPLCCLLSIAVYFVLEKLVGHFIMKSVYHI